MSGPTDPPEWEKAHKGRAQSAFDRARTGQQQTEASKAPERGQSEQVRKSAPIMQPKPPTQTRQAVDRGAHNERMQKDSAATNRARDLQAGIARRKEAEKTKDKDAQKGKDKDRER